MSAIVERNRVSVTWGKLILLISVQKRFLNTNGVGV